MKIRIRSTSSLTDGLRGHIGRLAANRAARSVRRASAAPHL